jgi:hypothetical protein
MTFRHCLLVLLGPCLLTARSGFAQSGVQPTTGDTVRTQPRIGPRLNNVLFTARYRGESVDSTWLDRPLIQEESQSRGSVALRGLWWGAVVGGFLGYLANRDDEWGGAIVGPIAGAVIGAPIGMVVFLLVTPP